jgi:hypothetical protein
VHVESPCGDSDWRFNYSGLTGLLRPNQKKRKSMLRNVEDRAPAAIKKTLPTVKGLGEIVLEHPAAEKASPQRGRAKAKSLTTTTNPTPDGALRCPNEEKAPAVGLGFDSN